MAMIQIWRCQWGTAEEIERLRKNGTPLITADRLAANMGKAADAAFERGKSRGRFEMREDIEQGRVAPVEVLP